MPHHPKNTGLSIRLTESAVFLRTNNPTGRSASIESPHSLLRGLLILDLAKPTKITSIKLELSASSKTSWPEGPGTRRIDVTADSIVYSATATYFQASDPPRRTASLGPGVYYLNDDEVELESSWRGHDGEEHTVRRGREAPRLANSASSPSVQDVRGSSVDPSVNRYEAPSYYQPESPLYSPSATDESSARSQSTSALDAPLGFRAPSIRSFPENSVSRAPSFEGVPEYREAVSSTRSPRRTMIRTPPSAESPVASIRSPSNDRTEHGARSRSRFSLTNVSNALRDAVRPLSGPSVSRERGGGLAPRGRAAQKAEQEDEDDEPENEDSGATWKEFKAGTYTYPISFTIPGDAPPTLRAPYGSISWRLKGTVHRPGTFTSKLTAFRHVMVIHSQSEEDTEDTENIIVERQWDQQLQYLVTISGRCFYIGGTISISITLMPLAKIKIHRFAVFLEETTEYYGGPSTPKPVRTDPVNRVQLLSVKHETPEMGPLLPLASDDPDAFMRSPLRLLAGPDNDLGALVAELMGPGPWAFRKELLMPESCCTLQFTNKNRKSNIIVNHVLKCLIRVERGDDMYMDAKTGRRKLFDIVIQSPVQVLSVRLRLLLRLPPEWDTAASHSRARDDSIDRHGASVAAVDGVVIDPSFMPSLRGAELGTIYNRNVLFERLMAGQESEVGEAPPAYEHHLP
ncbi:hypothetical protein FISHEDRAFT_47966 [Fistulina hepatica ATCC 64428]|uniref:Arrestin C-terminal-like domain-containing protein n=1 Tax=Fistulina hepatica ATCC 64428 TaxID=1128425 RepID=A0A0D7A5D8_9AGAR|nr:hypothetical protein FISHEDRAFT_47966 [Fistulina hepatica ATCC 64428]